MRVIHINYFNCSDAICLQANCVTTVKRVKELQYGCCDINIM